MTRINVVPVQELNNQMLLAEYYELPRVFTLVRNAQNKGKNKWNLDVPSEYTLGKGHVKFFFFRLEYLLNRYCELIEELLKRGYKLNWVPFEELTQGIHESWFGWYKVTDEALDINRKRIQDRLNGIKE